MKYSIWLIPQEPVFSQLKRIIVDLVSRYEGPIFNPHSTLLGSINQNLKIIQEKTEELASKIDTLKLSLEYISFSTTYFQSVFVRVKSTAQLLQLNLDMKELLHVENNVFMPHISLLYGDHDMKTREKIVSEIKIKPSFFRVNEFVIIRETASPKEWRPVAIIPF